MSEERHHNISPQERMALAVLVWLTRRMRVEKKPEGEQGVPNGSLVAK